jgi:hypothetical protein
LTTEIPVSSANYHPQKSQTNALAISSSTHKILTDLVQQFEGKLLDVSPNTAIPDGSAAISHSTYQRLTLRRRWRQEMMVSWILSGASFLIWLVLDILRLGYQNLELVSPEFKPKGPISSLANAALAEIADSLTLLWRWLSANDLLFTPEGLARAGFGISPDCVFYLDPLFGIPK